MKKYIFVFFALALSFGFVSCSEDDYKNMDLLSENNAKTAAEDQAKADEKESGTLKASFSAINLDGQKTTTFDMGEMVTFLDESTGRPDSREWTFEGANPSSSTDMSPNVIYPIGGTYDVTLKVTKKDGTTDEVTLNDYLTINTIPVSCDISSIPSATNGTVTIKTGDYVKFNQISSGLPTDFEWEFEGGDPTSTTGSSVEVRYTTPGTYKVKLKAIRMDGDQEVSAVKELDGYVNVVQREVKLNNINVTDDIISLSYSDGVMADLSSIKNDISVSIKTKNGTGTEIIPTITSVERDADNANIIKVKLNQTTYSDDNVYVSQGGALKDSTELTDIAPTTNFMAYYGKSRLVDGGFENESWTNGSINSGGPWTYEYVNPSQGNVFVHLTKDDSSVSVFQPKSFTLTAGEKFIIEFDAQKEAGAGGGIEFRFTSDNTGNGRLGDGIGGNWTNAGSFPIGSWKRVRKEKTYIGSGLEKCYFYILFYGHGDVYIDNVRIFTDNPRP